MASAPFDKPSTRAMEGAAQQVVNQLPALLLEARRVAATVAQGIHGRRRAGQGETFWQFRNFEQGDSAAVVDWRRSASSSHLYVREREWEAAHTVWIWPDLSSSMHFRSHLSSASKAERAIVLALALASLLSDGGERIGIPGLMQPKTRRNVTAPVMELIAKNTGSFGSLPGAEVRLSRHSEIVVFSDLLMPPAELADRLRIFARQGVRGHVVQILDPAEESLPYSGRIEFYDDERGTRYIAERAETLRDAYKSRLAAHKAAISALTRELGWTPFFHHTDRPAVEALLPLHLYLSGLDKAYAAKTARLTRDPAASLS